MGATSIFSVTFGCGSYPSLTTALQKERPLCSSGLCLCLVLLKRHCYAFLYLWCAHLPCIAIGRLAQAGTCFCMVHAMGEAGKTQLTKTVC